VSAWRRFKRPLPMAGLITVALLVGVALFADLLASDLPLAIRTGGRTYLLPAWFEPPELRGATIDALEKQIAGESDAWLVRPPVPYGPHRTDLASALAPPSALHPLGTDELGRDVLARMVHGAQVSLSVGFVAVLLYVVIGVALGAAAGYFGGRVDLVVSRLTEVLMSFPTFFLVLCVLGLLRAPSLLPVMIVLGLTRWTDISRLVRGEVLRVRELDFVIASRALGAGSLRVIVSHLLPHAMGPVLVSATFGIAGAILLESALSFLGFGVPPPHPSWGELLTQAHRYVTYPGAWWLTVYPGLALFLTLTAFNLVGEGLRDAFDPR